MSSISPNPANQPSQPSVGKSNRLATRLFLTGFVALVVIPMFAVGIVPSERAKWLEAKAIEHELDGEYSEAISTLDELVSLKTERNRAFRMARVELLLENGDIEEATVEAEAIVEEHPTALVDVDSAADIDVGFEHVQLLAKCYQSSGQFERAADLWLDIKEQTNEIESPMLVNSLAYANALAGRDLFDSWDQMNEIIMPGYHRANLYHMSAFMHYMFLREGERFLAEHLDERERIFQLALSDYSDAIRERKRLLATVEATQESANVVRSFGAMLSELANQLIVEEPMAEDETGTQTETEAETEKDQAEDDQSDVDPSEETDAESTATQVRKDLALLYVHRAKLFEVVGDSESAQRDWDVVKELGFSRRILGRQEIDPSVSLRRLSEMSAWLDTRGYLMYRMGRHRLAKKDMDQAIQFMESLVSVARFMESQRAIHSPDTRRESRMVRLMQQGLAVLIYHRYLVHQAVDDQEAAAVDLRRIQELGEEPGPHLF